MFGVYIHWPFCASKCPYCDFNSHVAEAIDHDRWRESYLREMDHVAALTPGREVTSIFFGGGTPSLMNPETVAAVIAGVADRWNLTHDAEITLEANPTSVESGKFAAFGKAGINRVSLGIQSLNEEDLIFLGRKHTSAEALKALEIANENFDRVSFDLIYARPNQTLSDWQQELEKALTFTSEHLSLYQLTIEEGTPFFVQHERGDFSIPEQDTGGAFYEMTQDILGAAGLNAYEISNHARPGRESRHNLTYWRYADYAGIGPGAHGRLTLADGVKYATRGHRAPEVWLDRVRDVGQGGHPFEPLRQDQRWMESLMMGLRLAEGVPLARLEAEAGGAAWQTLIDSKRMDALVTEGLLSLNDNRLTPTRAGMQRLNGVLAYLL